MNCWFCDHKVKDAYCEEQPCRSHYVTYVFFKTTASGVLTTTLFKVELIVSLWNKDYKRREYVITYKVNDKIMEVVERILLPRAEDDESVSVHYDWKHVFKIPYDKPIITPTNFKDKLPTLLTFS
jgi:hypothetical protein